MRNLFCSLVSLDNNSKIFTDTGSYSKADLKKAILRASCYFKNNKIEKIVFCAPNSYEFVVLALGALHSGARSAILHSDSPFKMVKKVANNLDADLIVYNNELSLKKSTNKPSKLLSDLFLDISNLSINDDVSLDAPSLSGEFVLTSSGTTGQPKLIVHDLHSLYSTAKTYLNILEITSNDRCLITRPMSHISGLGEVLSTIISNCEIKLPKSLVSSNVIEEIMDYKPSYLSLCLPIVNELLDMVSKDNSLLDLFKKTRKIRSGGSYIPENTLGKFESEFGICLETLYGASECCPMMYNDQTVSIKKASLGKPVDGGLTKVVDPDSQKEVPPGEIGELHVFSEKCFKGYLVDGQILPSNSWYATKDLVIKDESGYFWFKGRSNNLIQKSNESIFPVEIESAMLEHERVVACVTVAKPDPLHNFVPVAWYRTIDSLPIENDELHDHLINYIRPMMIPDLFHYCQDFPLLSNGKIDRKKIAEITKIL